MFNNKKNKVKKSAVKTDRKSKRGKKIDQQLQSSNDHEEEATQEELAYLETQARLYQAESDEEEEQGTRHYQEDDNESSAGEDEHLQSESRLKRTDQAEEDARVFQADEDKLPPSANKKRRQAQDQTTGITFKARLSQAEQPQGPFYPNPDLSSPPSTSPNSAFVGASTQSVSSANAYQGDITRNSDDITLNLDLGRQGAVTDDGIASNTMISRLARLNHVKSVAVNDQKISRGLEIIRSQETISLLDPDFIALRLDEAQIDKIIDMYETDPQPK